MVDAHPIFRSDASAEELVADRVRRQTVAMLAHHRTPDARVLPVFERILAQEEDRKLRLHAEHGAKRYAEAGLRA